MLIRTTLLGGAMLVLLAACSGSSKEFSGGAGKGGTAGSAGSVADTGEGGAGDASAAGGKGGSSGAASAGKGGGKSGNAGSSGKGGTTSGAGTAGTSGSSPAGTSGTTGEGGATPAGTSIDEAAAAVAVGLCTKAFDCCSAEELKASYGVDTVISCEIAVAFLVQTQVNAAAPAIDAGRVEYDGSALDTCLTGYGDRSCDMLRTLTSFECEGLLVPQQAAGDACGISAECVEGYCDGSSNAKNPVGQCVPKKADGADCSANAECVSEFCSGVCGAASAQALCGG